MAAANRCSIWRRGRPCAAPLPCPLSMPPLLAIRSPSRCRSTSPCAADLSHHLRISVMIHAALAIPARPISRSQRLMEATRSAHDGLDTRIISAEPFRDRDRYVRLLRMQYHFYQTIDGLYTTALPL